MAHLVDRILGWNGEHAIGAHSWVCAMGELERGETTKVEIVGFWSLDSEMEGQFDQLIAHVQAMDAAERFKYRGELADVLYLAAAGVKYDTRAKVHTRLGIT
jgi:hypothetical protein